MSGPENPFGFLNGVTVYRDSLDIRLPWTLINFFAPTEGRSIHYLSHMEEGNLVIDSRDTLSDGIAATIAVGDELYQTGRLTWEPWDYATISENPPLERKKQSYHTMKQMLPFFNTPPIGLADTFEVFPGEDFYRGADGGLLANDLDADGNQIEARLSFGNAASRGNLQLHPDGSFRYTPDEGFRGVDRFMYYLDDGSAYSTLVPVTLSVQYPLGTGESATLFQSSVYPNPARDRICVTVPESFSGGRAELVDPLGRVAGSFALEDPVTWYTLQNITPGFYLLIVRFDQKVEQHRILIR
jgi:hypothetical protein